MTVTLHDILRMEVPPGAYYTRNRYRPNTIRRAVEERGWRFFHLDGSAITDKASFLGAIAEAMHFPRSSGRNWDALADSLRDLSWVSAKGYVLLYDGTPYFEEAQPEEWETAFDIMSDTANNWHAIDVPFYVLLRRLE